MIRRRLEPVLAILHTGSKPRVPLVPNLGRAEGFPVCDCLASRDGYNVREHENRKESSR